MASPVPIRITGERQSLEPTRLPENVSPNTDQMAVGGLHRRAEVGASRRTGRSGRPVVVMDLAG